MTQKILVTGADGFVGSHLVEYLLENNYDVKAFVYYNSFNSWGWLDNIDPKYKNELEVVSGDIRDANCVNNAVKGCDIILHLAALIAIPFSYDAPEAYIDTNIKGTLNIVQAARNHNVKRVVCTSTSEVYGTAQYVPIDEKHPLHGQSPYSASKIGADQIATSFHRSFETPVTIIRPFNIYGPRQSARAVIPTIISQIANGATEIKLGSLTPTRDFTFVKDVAKGFIEIANCDAAIGEVVNTGSNFEISIGDLVKLTAKLMNKDVTILADDQRIRPKNSEVERLFSSTEKAQKLWGWNPDHGGETGFSKGLEKTIKWFQNPENLKLYKSNIYNI